MTHPAPIPDEVLDAAIEGLSKNVDGIFRTPYGALVVSAALVQLKACREEIRELVSLLYCELEYESVEKYAARALALLPAPPKDERPPPVHVKGDPLSKAVLDDRGPR